MLTIALFAAALSFDGGQAVSVITTAPAPDARRDAAAEGAVPTRRVCRLQRATGSNMQQRVCRDVPAAGTEFQDQQTRDFMRSNQRVRTPDVG
ncbi:hypothetical protein [Brevundimonas lenta]|uniref:Uncharacterized protein n=1 Tax=Brevundimonas lenta TaxID=424796 RepID=A0A7W6JAN8_9CAUL|nr:hypothetical protein [Brevundimonas lenta]MBB4081624.1 hypothetical protein [Brevundimonas lenta]